MTGVVAIKITFGILQCNFDILISLYAFPMTQTHNLSITALQKFRGFILKKSVHVQ